MTYSIILILQLVFVKALCSKMSVPDLKVPVNLIALGDWGGISEPPYSTKIQRQVAKEMRSYSLHKNLSFILSLGDNFYPYGIEPGQTQIRFKHGFEDVYLKDNLKQVPWYTVAGIQKHVFRIRLLVISNSIYLR